MWSSLPSSFPKQFSPKATGGAEQSGSLWSACGECDAVVGCQCTSEMRRASMSTKRAFCFSLKSFHLFLGGEGGFTYPGFIKQNMVRTRWEIPVGHKLHNTSGLNVGKTVAGGADSDWRKRRGRTQGHGACGRLCEEQSAYVRDDRPLHVIFWFLLPLRPRLLPPSLSRVPQQHRADCACHFSPSKENIHAKGQEANPGFSLHGIC